MNLFSGLWAKLVGIMGATLGIMAVMLKLKSNKIENLEQENAAHEKEDEIIDDMKLAEVKIEEKEDEEIENIVDSDWRSGI